MRPEGEAVYRVKGATSSLILKRSLEHYASKSALDIDSLGEKNVAALVDSGLVKDIADIYTLTFDQVVELDRFADISSKKLINGIENKKQPTLAKFIYALGIRHVGAQTAIDLANTFKNLDNLGIADYATLKEVNGIGEIVAESLLAWFADDDNMALLAKFRKLGVWPEEVKKVGGPLSGKSFVITGSLTSMGRDLAGEKIRSLGGTFQSSVSADCTYLVMGEKAGASKADKARKLGTEVIDETKLLELFSMNAVYVTGNEHKAKYFKKMVGLDIPHQAIELDEIQSLSLVEVVTHKAKQAYGIVKKPVIVEDTKLTFLALGELPGPFIKWFQESLGNEGLCRMLDGYEDTIGCCRSGDCLL